MCGGPPAPNLVGMDRGTGQALPVESIIYATAALSVLAMFSLGIF
jgi:hypothetical protein